MIPSLLRRWPSGPGWRCGNRGHMVETSHLLLRRPRSGDLEAIKTVMDAEFIRWNGYPTDDEKLTAMATAWIHKVRRKPYRESWLICDRSSGDVIGMRTIMSDESDSRICATGSSLAPGWRGRGLGTEELATFIGLLKHLGFQHVIASATSDNIRAINMYTKLGFSRIPKSLSEFDANNVWMGLQIYPQLPQCCLR